MPTAVNKLHRWDVFQWNNDLFRIIRQEDDNTIVQRVASWWPYERRWKYYETVQEENFNPYCEVNTNFTNFTVVPHEEDTDPRDVAERSSN